LRNNQTKFDNIPPSPLYRCKKCQKNLKLWPKENLSSSICKKCKNWINNDGTNLHVCFTCQGDISIRNHLCSNHLGRDILEVDFDDLEHLTAWYESGNEESMPLVKSEPIKDNVNPPPPAYDEAITEPPQPGMPTWNDRMSMGAANMRSRMIRQTSTDMNNAVRGFRRMVSSSDQYPPQHSDQYPPQPSDQYPTQPDQYHLQSSDNTGYPSAPQILPYSSQYPTQPSDNPGYPSAPKILPYSP